MDLRTIALPLYQARRWIKFLGGVLVGAGVVYAVTVVGLLFAWLFVWLGVLLWQAGSEIDRAFPEGEEVALAVAFGKLRRFFVVWGIATLVYLVVLALGLAVVGVFALLGIVL